MNANPTPYPNVNEVLNLLLRRVQAILGDQFVGMYLYGSLSSGDFDPASSDIDFLVVTTGSLSKDKIAALESMHRQLWSSDMKWAARLEGSYVPRVLIRRHDPDGEACVTVNEGAFLVAKRGSDWIIQRHVVRECGVVLAGPDPKTLIDPVSAEEIRSAVRGILEEWWFPMLEDPSWLAKRGSQYHAYAVITMCRVLHALEHGTIVSKPKAAAWARERLGDAWKPLIDKAISAAKHETQGDFLDGALDLIRFVRDKVPEFDGGQAA